MIFLLLAYFFPRIYTAHVAIDSSHQSQSMTATRRRRQPRSIPLPILETPFSNAAATATRRTGFILVIIC